MDLTTLVPMLSTNIPAYFVLGPLVVLLLMLIVLMFKSSPTPQVVQASQLPLATPSASVPVVAPLQAPSPSLRAQQLEQAYSQPAPTSMPIVQVPPVVVPDPVTTPAPTITQAPVPQATPVVEVVQPAQTATVPPVSAWKPAAPAPASSEQVAQAIVPPVAVV